MWFKRKGSAPSAETTSPNPLSELTGIQKMELEQKRLRDEEDKAAKEWQRKDTLEKIANLRKKIGPEMQLLMQLEAQVAPYIPYNPFANLGMFGQQQAASGMQSMMSGLFGNIGSIQG